jgi:hypothetical protein
MLAGAVGLLNSGAASEMYGAVSAGDDPGMNSTIGINWWNVPLSFNTLFLDSSPL